MASFTCATLLGSPESQDLAVQTYSRLLQGVEPPLTAEEVAMMNRRQDPFTLPHAENTSTRRIAQQALSQFRELLVAQRLEIAPLLAFLAEETKRRMEDLEHQSEAKEQEQWVNALTFEVGGSRFGDLSRDGKWLVVGSQHKGSVDLHEISRSGKKMEYLFPGALYDVRISPDSKWIGVVGESRDSREVFVSFQSIEDPDLRFTFRPAKFHENFLRYRRVYFHPKEPLAIFSFEMGDRVRTINRVYRYTDREVQLDPELSAQLQPLGHLVDLQFSPSGKSFIYRSFIDPSKRPVYKPVVRHWPPQQSEQPRILEFDSLSTIHFMDHSDDEVLVTNHEKDFYALYRLSAPDQRSASKVFPSAKVVPTVFSLPLNLAFGSRSGFGDLIALPLMSETPVEGRILIEKVFRPHIVGTLGNLIAVEVGGERSPHRILIFDPNDIQ